jgi:hypothetical protein
MSMILARTGWPDWFDVALIQVFVICVIVLPALGHWFMVVDIRKYLRALRGALVTVSRCFVSVPSWACQETPPCLRALGLSLPCTPAQVKRAYRRMAERLHPDRGGDSQGFLVLQEHFEKALQFLHDHDLTGGEDERGRRNHT